MKIAVLGTGRVGSTIGRGLGRAGHQVVYGVRHVDKNGLAELVKDTGPLASVVPIREAADQCEIVVLAVPFGAAQNTLIAAGQLAGKIIVDCTNPFREALIGVEVISAAEQVASWVPGARVVKAFNTTGSGNLADPAYGSLKLTMFLCGNDADANKAVAALAADLGFEPIDCGPLKIARQLESLALLWIHLAYAQQLGPDIGIVLVTRPAERADRNWSPQQEEEI